LDGPAQSLYSSRRLNQRRAVSALSARRQASQPDFDFSLIPRSDRRGPVPMRELNTKVF